MTADNVTEIIHRLDALTSKVEAIADDVAEIKPEVKKTNGRVTKIELWIARFEGGRAALGWVTPVGVGVTCSVVGVIAARLLS